MIKRKQSYSPAQTSFIDEIIVDNFAGGGGASTGIELAAGRPVAEALIRANLPEWHTLLS